MRRVHCTSSIAASEALSVTGIDDGLPDPGSPEKKRPARYRASVRPLRLGPWGVDGRRAHQSYLHLGGAHRACAIFLAPLAVIADQPSHSSAPRLAALEFNHRTSDKSEQRKSELLFLADQIRNQTKDLLPCLRRLAARSRRRQQKERRRHFSANGRSERRRPDNA